MIVCGHHEIARSRIFGYHGKIAISFMENRDGRNPTYEAFLACKTLVDITISSLSVLLRTSFPVTSWGEVVFAEKWFETRKVLSKESEGPGKAGQRASCPTLALGTKWQKWRKRMLTSLERRAVSLNT